MQLGLAKITKSSKQHPKTPQIPTWGWWQLGLNGIIVF